MMKKKSTLLAFLLILSSYMVYAQESLINNYNSYRIEVALFQKQLDGYILNGDINSFVNHFKMQDRYVEYFKKWFKNIQNLKSKYRYNSVSVNLPVLGVSDKDAFTSNGSFEAGFVYNDSLIIEKFDVPELIISREEGKLYFTERLPAPLSRKSVASVSKAVYTVTPDLQYGANVESEYLVKNTSSVPIDTLFLYIRHPLDVINIKLNGKPMIAKSNYGNYEKSSLNEYSINLEKPLNPNKTVKLSFSYNVTYKNYKLSRKPVGFTSDRAFILGESFWYPKLKADALEMFPYEITIKVKKGFKAVSAGSPKKVLNDSEYSYYSFKNNNISYPFFVWGKYSDLLFETGGIQFSIWTPSERKINPLPFKELFDKILFEYSKILPRPGFKERHNIIAVTRFGGYGETGNLLLEDKYFIDSYKNSYEIALLIAHEMAHSWLNSIAKPSGALSHFLSEGLAEYLSSKCIEKLYGVVVANQLWSQLLNNYANLSYRALSPVEMNEGVSRLDNPMFRAVTYNKGAYFFREIEGMIGEEKLFKSLSTLFNSKRGREYNIEDIISGLKTYEAINPDFFTSYVKTNNHPDIKVLPVDETNIMEKVKIVSSQNRVSVPVRVACYDSKMNIIHQDTLSFIDKIEHLMDYSHLKNISHIKIDPQRYILQNETRNDVYPDFFITDKESKMLSEIINSAFLYIKERNLLKFEELLAKEPNNLNPELRKRFISEVAKSELANFVLTIKSVEFFRTSEETIDSKVILTINTGKANVNTIANVNFVFENSDWKLTKLGIVLAGL